MTVTTMLYVIEGRSGWRDGEETWAVLNTTTDRKEVRELLTFYAFQSWDTMKSAVDDGWNRSQRIEPRSVRCRNVLIEIPLLEDSRDVHV